jgi:hypothetical protein
MTMHDFDYKSWGRERLVLLQVGYMFLTNQTSKISEETKIFLDELGLGEKIGKVSLRLAENDERPGLMIAERLYSHIISRDEDAYQAALDKNEKLARVFRDPLTYSRYASSLFLQDRYGQAKSALDQILFTPDWNKLLTSDQLKEYDVSPYELYMRHSQYVVFKFYQEDEGLIDNLKSITKDLEQIAIGLIEQREHFDEKLFRAASWSYLVVSYIRCLNSVIPSFYATGEQNEVMVSGYLKMHAAKGFSSLGLQKPELAAAACILETESNKFTRCFVDTIDQLKKESKYPRAARFAFASLLTRVAEARARQSTSKPRVFFSYSHKDRKVANRIMGLLADTGIEILSDNLFKAGDSLLQGMEQAIKKSEIAVILVTSSYLASDGWLQKERETIFARSVDKLCELKTISYGVTPKEISEEFPMLANNLMVNLEDTNIELQVFKLSDSIHKSWEASQKISRARKNQREGK